MMMQSNLDNVNGVLNNRA